MPASVAGYEPRAAFVVGMGGVLAALVLALASDSVAFLSNVTSGLESIIQFGIAAAIALVAAFFVLGIVTPLVLMHIDERIGSRQTRGLRRVGSEVGSGLAATGAMAVVLFLVYLLPVVGVALWAIYLLAAVLGPYMVARRRLAEGTVPVTPAQLRGTLIGRAVAAVARRRMVLPVVLVSWLIAVFLAVQIEPRFDVKDFFAADSDFVVGLDKLDEHVGQQGGESADVYVEADLTRLETLRALGDFADAVRSLDVEQLAIDDHGVTQLQDGVLGLIGDVMDTPFAVNAIGTATGTAPADTDEDGFPDTPEQVAALYAFTTRAGVPLDTERLIRTPDSVG